MVHYVLRTPQGRSSEPAYTCSLSRAKCGVAVNWRTLPAAAASVTCEWQGWRKPSARIFQSEGCVRGRRESTKTLRPRVVRKNHRISRQVSLDFPIRGRGHRAARHPWSISTHTHARAAGQTFVSRLH